MMIDAPGSPLGAPVIKATTAMWKKAENETPPLGVLCVEILSNDTIRVKMGNGVNTYKELPYFANEYTLSKVADWAPNVPYEKNNLVSYNGSLMMALENLEPSTVFDASKWKAISSQEVSNEIASKLPSVDANHNLLDNATAVASPTDLKINFSFYNLYNKETGQKVCTIPLADETNSGAMSAAAYAQLQNNTTRIQALEGRVSFFLVDMSAIGSDTPTQAELLALFKTASGMDDPFDGATLVSEDNTSIRYRYYASAATWKLDNTGGVGIASQNNLGVVSGSTEKGKVFVEADGSMSLNDYDKIVEGKTYNAKGLSTDVDGSGNLPCVTEANLQTDSEDENKSIMDLIVKEDGVTKTGIKGISINGVRMDFEEKLLSIHTASERENFHLENGPYKVTSPYATVDMYGHLVIFDEEVPGKGIIRKPNGEIQEVTDLGIYAPDSSVNLIHILGPKDEEVCYIVNEKSQSTTLLFYPDGTYKTVDMPNGNSAYTPQNIQNVELLTSVDYERHSLFMYDHKKGVAGGGISAYILLQLETGKVSVVDETTPPCTGYGDTFDLTKQFTAMKLTWEGNTDYKDLEPDSSNVIDTTYADSSMGNRRLPYKTGAWNTMHGSVRKYRPITAEHNGVYHSELGAQIMWEFGSSATNTQVLFATPEGFLGWSNGFAANVSAENRNYREIELRSGDYAGKKAIILYSNKNTSTNHIFFVNTPDGNPEKTVCSILETNTANLNAINDRNPIASGTVIPWRPNHVLVDKHRIYFADGDENITDTITKQHRWFTYINQSEIAPCESVGEEVYRQFDLHCIDAQAGVEDGVTREWNACGFEFMEYINFGTEANPYKGILVKGIGNIDVFLPDEPDEWVDPVTIPSIEAGEGEEVEEEPTYIPGYWKNAPYFVHRDDNSSNFNPLKVPTNMRNWARYANTCATWHRHHFQCLGIGNYIENPAINPTNRVLDYYLDEITGKVVCGAIYFDKEANTTKNVGLPIIVSDDLMLFWNFDGSANCLALFWNPENEMADYVSPDDFEPIFNGDWTPPRGTTGLILYKEMDLSASLMQEGYVANLYFFDPDTSRSDYVKLAIKRNYPTMEADEGDEASERPSVASQFVPEYSLPALPRQMAVGNLIAYSNNRVILTTAGNDTVCSYLTVNSGQALAVMYPDNCHLKDVYDITNPFNPEESSNRAYAIFAGDKSFFYVLERDVLTGIPQLTRYSMAEKVQGRLWALPHGEVDGVKTLRFAMGAPNFKNATPGTPFTIIERIGGTVQGDANPFEFTKVRDVKLELEDGLFAGDAGTLSTPELIPYDKGSVRFGNQEFNFNNLEGSTYSANQDMELLGIDDDGQPVYGQRDSHGTNNYIWANPTANSFNSKLDKVVAEVGMDAGKDNWYNLRPMTNNYMPARKIADGWKAFAEDTPFSTDGDSSLELAVKGGENATVWLLSEDSTRTGYFNLGEHRFKKALVSLAVASSANNKLKEGKRIQVLFDIPSANLKGSTIAAFATRNIMNSCFNATFRKEKFSLLLTYYDVLDHVPAIFDLSGEHEISAADFLNHTAQLPVYAPVQSIDPEAPLFDLHTNQILSGIYHRRNNQLPNALEGPEGEIPPYFEFTDDNCSMVFKGADNLPIEGIKPFYDQVRTCHPRAGDRASIVFMNRDEYDLENGTAYVSCFLMDENNVAKFQQIEFPDANEIIKALSYTNNKMEFFATVKSWSLTFPTLSPERIDIAPLATASVYFNFGLELAMLLSDDGFNVHMYVPQSLVITYKGEVVETISLKDLILRGQTMAEYMSIINTMSVNLVNANKVITQMAEMNNALLKKCQILEAKVGYMEVDTLYAKNLLLESKYPDVTY